MLDLDPVGDVGHRRRHGVLASAALDIVERVHRKPEEQTNSVFEFGWFWSGFGFVEKWVVYMLGG